MNCLPALDRLLSPLVGARLTSARPPVEPTRGTSSERPASPRSPGSSSARSGWHWKWIPIRVLKTRHRERIAQHLLALSARDRYLRFGYPASDERIRHYVAELDFQRDELFGIFNRRLELVAMTHLAYADGETLTGIAGDTLPMAEFAVSVATETRGRGYGARLFAHATMHARNRRVDRLFIHALSENTPMLRIARHAGASVVHDGGESEAWLQLPGDNLASHMEELISSQAAEINYGLKRQRVRLGRFVTVIADLRRRMGALRKTASQ